jgi:putative membrane protein
VTFVRILVWWAINLLGLWAAAWLVEGISYDGFWFLVLAALVFGLINLVLRPILILLTLPAVILTLGILILFINAFLLWLTGAIFGDKYEVDDFFWAAVLGAIVIWAVNLLLSLVLPQPMEPRSSETAPAQTDL